MKFIFEPPPLMVEASQAMPNETLIRIKHLYVSGGHNYFGHHGQVPGISLMESRDQIMCVEGRGIEGDRFFDYKRDYKGQITFFSEEIHLELAARFRVFDKPASAFRRNVITAGVDLITLIGKEFTIQGVRFLGTAECTPCYWMDEAFHPGTEEALRGRGGLRAKILSSGPLRVNG